METFTQMLPTIVVALFTVSLVMSCALYVVYRRLVRTMASLDAALVHAEHYRSLSLTDPLTGMPNRRAFEERVDQVLATTDRYGDDVHPACYTMVTIDLDQFKYLNDILGHGVGDEALIIVARILKTHVRTSDVIGRLGGDEFAILFVGADILVAETVLQRIRAEYETEIQLLCGIYEKQCPREVTLSFGAAERLSSKKNRIELLALADSDLYRKKPKRFRSR